MKLELPPTCNKCHLPAIKKPLLHMGWYWGCRECKGEVKTQDLMEVTITNKTGHPLAMLSSPMSRATDPYSHPHDCLLPMCMSLKGGQCKFHTLGSNSDYIECSDCSFVYLKSNVCNHVNGYDKTYIAIISGNHYSYCSACLKFKP